MINIFFVRHGQTYLNMYYRIQGLCDAPLTPQGVQDAKAAGQRLSKIKFNAAYASDRPRAIHTAEYILARNPTSIKKPTINKAFREENFGYFEGEDGEHAWHIIGGPHGDGTYNAMINDFGMSKVLDMIHDADPFHDAESSTQVKQRFEKGLHQIVNQAHDGDNILVAAHGTIIRWIASEYGNHIDVSQSTKNGSVTKMVVDHNHPVVKYFNKVDSNL